VERFQELERGAAYFFGLQRMLIVLHPEGRDVYRVLVIGRRRLPEPVGRRRVRGYVESAYRDPAQLLRELQGLGPTGEGAYDFTRHEDHVHWTFELTSGRRGAYLILGRDPKAALAPRLDPRQPELELGLPVRTRTWTALSSPSALDAPGAEFVLAGARADPGLRIAAFAMPPPPLWKPGGSHGILPA
jgi:hypothetical protein